MCGRADGPGRQAVREGREVHREVPDARDGPGQDGRRADAAGRDRRLREGEGRVHGDVLRPAAGEAEGADAGAGAGEQRDRAEGELQGDGDQVGRDDLRADHRRVRRRPGKVSAAFKRCGSAIRTVPTTRSRPSTARRSRRANPRSTRSPVRAAGSRRWRCGSIAPARAGRCSSISMPRSVSRWRLPC